MSADKPCSRFTEQAVGSQQPIFSILLQACKSGMKVHAAVHSLTRWPFLVVTKSIANGTIARLCCDTSGGSKDPLLEIHSFLRRGAKKWPSRSVYRTSMLLASSLG